MKSLQPPKWPRPSGYSNGISARGRMIFTAGVVGWETNGKFFQTSLAGQFHRALQNICDILREDGAGPRHVVRMTCYVTSIDDYDRSLKAIGEAWKQVMGNHYPAMALVEVRRLVESDALIEIEATAVVEE